jgi:7-carboxy-7-deazaguanine synthase
MRYPVNEVFETVQGEAGFTGTPAVFIRLQGCPVGCSWCDTKHTWEVKPERHVSLQLLLDKTSDADTWTELSEGDVVALVGAFDARHVVITGGEPCLHNLEPLTRALLSAGRSVQVETSGTHPIRVAPSTFVTVSPKLDMAGGFDVLDDALQRADEVKHVLGKALDFEKLSSRILPKLRPGTPVWLQPLSQSPVATRLCVRLATSHGHRVSVQVHKFLGVR